MDTTVQFISIFVILLTFIIFVNVAQFVLRRRQAFPLRPIDAFNRIPKIVSESIEASRPIHMSLGTSDVGGDGTLVSLASAELFYQIIKQTAIGDKTPIITVARTEAIPLGIDTLRRAYQKTGYLERYQPINVRWYPSSRRVLAFAAAISAMQNEDDVASNVLAGTFGSELALIIDSAHRRDRPVFAVSNDLTGQAVAYAMADDVLIGEEVFVASGYLSNDAGYVSVGLTMDILRWIVVIAIVGTFIYSIVTQAGG